MVDVCTPGGVVPQAFFIGGLLNTSMKRIEVIGAEPITLTQAKEYLGVSHDDQDDLIANLITSAREDIEKSTNIALVESEWEETYSCFPCVIKLKEPYNQLLDFTYTDSDGNTQDVDSSVYDIHTRTSPAQIRLAYGQVWPTNRDWYGSIVVSSNAGWVSVGDYDLWGGPQELAILVSEIVYARFHQPDWDLTTDLGSKMERVLNHYRSTPHIA